MFQPSATLGNAEARRRISALEGQIAELQSELSQQTLTQEQTTTALEAEVAQLKQVVETMAAQVTLSARRGTSRLPQARLRTCVPWFQH
jgi:TolA-binding protein